MSSKKNELEFRTACTDGDAAAVSRFIRMGVNVNCLWPAFNMSALHFASKNGHAEIVKELLENGANMNAINGFNQTPLHLATLHRHVATVRVLVECKANLDLKNKAENTPLHISCRDGHMDIAKLLLQNGADATIPDRDGNTAQQLAQSRGHLDIVNLFYNEGAKECRSNDISCSSTVPMLNSTTISQLPQNGARTEEIDNECRICLDVPSATAFLPCGHFCACESCAKLVEHCPICRGDITQCVKIYKS